MDGFIPTAAASATPTLIQSRTFLPGPGGPLTQNVSFLNAVAAGNLLIVMVTTRSSDGSGFSVPTGWTELSVIDANGFNGGSAFIGYRVADGTEGTGPFGFGTSSGTQRRIVIAEFHGVTEFIDRSQVDAHAATSALALGSVTPTAATPALLLAGAINGGTITAINTGYTSISGGFVEGGVNGPYSRLAYKAEASATGSYSATTAQSSAFECAGDHIAFSGDAGAITWISAPDTVDSDNASSDDVADSAISATSGVFWRGDRGTAESIGQLIARIGFDNAATATLLVQAGDLPDWSDATTVVTLEVDATGSLTGDDIDVSWDPDGAHQYFQLVLDSTAQDLRVYEVGMLVAEEPTDPPPGKAILEIYVHDEDASRWGVATWATGPATGTEGIWSAAGWQDVTPQGVNAHIIWGTRRAGRGILSEQGPASWNVQTFDPERTLDPGNFDGPYYPQLVAGVPIRISHDSMVIRTGIVDEWHYKQKRPDYQGQILASDTWSLLNQAMVPADSILGNTLLERIQDAINAAGIAVGGIPLPPGGPTGPTIADWVEGAAEDDPTSVGEHVRIATQEVLWVPFIRADGGLGLRSWGAPLDRGREIGAPNLEDLESLNTEDGVYSVVKVMPDPAGTPIIRKAAPMPRYGERVWERTEPTVDPEAYAAAILAERPWPGVQWVPGTIHCFSAADVNDFGSLEIMERVTISVPGAVSVQGRVLGGELFVEHREKSTSGATWQFYFAVATDGSTAIGSTILVADGTGDTIVDDMTETDFLEAD